MTIIRHYHETARHRTVWLESGPADGPLMIFLHGWPELSLVWKAQLKHFASAGWRCIAPDMRGYGGSSVPDTLSAYTVREIVTDMVEMHDALGGKPAVWVGHDWGSPIAWAMASHHPDKCRGVVSLCVPYMSRGLTIPSLLPHVNRALYPVDVYPVGQWDYVFYYRESFQRAIREFEVDVGATLAMAYGAFLDFDESTPSFSACIRRNGGWFGDVGRAPPLTDAKLILPQEDFVEMTAAYRRTGFGGGAAWYMNDAANHDYAAEAPAFGHLSLPALFVHAAWDMVLDTTRSTLAEPMREDCSDLTEVTIECGHEIMLDRPDELNTALENWLADKKIS